MYFAAVEIKLHSFTLKQTLSGYARGNIKTYSVKRSDVTRWKQGYIASPPPYFIPGEPCKGSPGVAW